MLTWPEDMAVSGPRRFEWFDNGPVQRMGDQVLRCVRQLGFGGCEVLQVRLDSFKATIQVREPCGIDPPHLDLPGGFRGVQWGDISVVWRGSVPESDGGEV